MSLLTKLAVFIMSFESFHNISTHFLNISLPDNLGFSKEGCKKHELFVSFRDLGWQV